ncbi:TolC family protein [Hydrogenimonas sp.]|uniref:TolC family protein n=1 Tax=Hydrogenimonas sp. TaxID=2231112 RepID=UPI002617F60E|nr:TolC family protein [Hydrogenimonas sp.]
MRKTFLLFYLLPFTFSLLPSLHAQTYRQVIEKVDNALVLERAKELEMAAGMQAEAAKGKNLPSLDAHLSAAYLKDTPTMILHFPAVPGPTSAIPMGTKEKWEGDVTLSYPLFTGFAVTASIDKATFEHQLASLKRLDLRRNLYLRTTRLYTAIYAADRVLDATHKALKAIEDAYRKAKGLYDNGLLPPADLYNIEAKKYAIEAEITEAQTEKERYMNRLSYLLNQPVDRIEPPFVSQKELSKERIIQTALRSREDIRALQTSLKIDESIEKLAKSRYYPTVGLAASLKKQGDTIELNGDGYTNADRSYVGAAASWNLFSGFSDEKSVEAARHRILAAKIELNDYKNRVKTDIENAFLVLTAIQSKLMSAKMEENARSEYYKLTEGRFENQLASADELSRAIADLAAARSKVSVLESEIFNQKAAIWLMGGIESFRGEFLAIEK